MAKRGRPPKPTIIKELTDNPGGRPLNKREPKPVGGGALPPADLTPGAREVWNRQVLGQAEGLFTICDEDALAAYCEAAALRRQLQADLVGQPRLVAGSTGQLVINPLIKSIADQSRLLATLGAELGMTPRARQSLEITPQNSKKASKFVGLIGSTKPETTKLQ